MTWTAEHSALDPVTSLGSGNGGEVGADDIGTDPTGLDHAEPLIR